jgi:hypothetical protein
MDVGAKDVDVDARGVRALGIHQKEGALRACQPPTQPLYHRLITHISKLGN